MLPSLIRFLHLALFGVSGMLPLLGAATVDPQLGWGGIWPLLLVAFGAGLTWAAAVVQLS